MSLKKTCLLLAMIAVLGMLLAANASAAPDPDPDPGEMWFLEVQFSGKGYEADTNSDPTTDPVYIEDKYTLDAQTIYLMYERDDRRLSFAYYNDDIQQWATSNINNTVYETEYSIVCSTPNNMTIHTDSLGNEVHATGTIRIQYKKKEGEPATAKLKSLGMGYTYVDEKEIEGQTVHVGVLKMKGKTIPQSEVPADVRTVFGLVP